MFASRFRDAYEAKLLAGWQSDPAQQAAVSAMARVLGSFASGGSRRVGGLYLHGPVGRGKTQLLKLFMECLEAVPARRVHMHAFMVELHRRLFEITTGDPVIQIARSLAGECRVLGFDEFYVSNIADGVLLGRLFQHLFEHGVVIVATSNWPMAQLYPGGRNRQRLLPFIKILETNLQAIDLGEGPDYRQDEESDWPLYVVAPAGSRPPPALARLFDQYAGSETEDAPALSTAVASAGRTAWYRFADLCEQPLGRREYLELVRRFDTLVIEGVPVFDPEDPEPALRMVALIDLCYEHNCRVIVSAAAYPDQLCTSGPAPTAFRRVASRLAEMQTWA